MSELRTLFSATPPEGWIACIDALHPHRDRETGEHVRLLTEWVLERDGLSLPPANGLAPGETDWEDDGGTPAVAKRRKRPGGIKHNGRRAKRRR